METNTPEPEKYIRTFSGDMETVQKGGTPDLIAFTKPATSEEGLVEVSPITPVQNMVPIELPPPPPTSAYVPPSPALAPIETYASDFAEKMKETQASTATVLAAEQDLAPRLSSTEPEQSSINIGYIVAGCALLLLGGGGAYFGYTRYLAVQTPIVVVPTVLAPIFVDEREELSGSGSTLLKAVEKSLAQPLASNKVKLLYVASSSDASIFSSLPLLAPDSLLRNVEARGSMAGIVSLGGSQSPFFILSVSSYSNTFSAMLLWEKTLLRNLGTLFPSYAVVEREQTSTTTSASATSSTPLVAIGFRDEVVSNHDVRVYRDISDRTIILYGYWNQKTLIIARDAAAFTEILQRLATSRALSQ